MGKFKNPYTSSNRMANWSLKYNKIIVQQPQTPQVVQTPGLILCKECQDTTQIDLHHAKAFVLSCIDFRLRDNITCNLTNLGYKNNYDDSAVAGASLGYNGLLDYDWVKTIDDNIDLAISLHDINEIIIIDHMYCGAYKAQYPDMVKGGVEEYNCHVENLNTTATSLQLKYNDFKIKKYIISVDGGTMVDIDTYKGSFPFK
jgi:hypothetical protein